MFKKPEVKEKWVGMPMKMNAFAHEGLFVVQKDENAFILYYLLGAMAQNYWTWGSVETTIITLSKQLLIKTKESDNRKEVKRLLLSLNNKGYIKINFAEPSLEYDTLLTIRMVDLDNSHIMDSVKSDNFWHTGWVAITEDMFKACNGNARHFRMMIYVEWRMFRGQENEGEYKISLGEWEKVLDISHPTAVSLVKEVQELNLIDKFRGARYEDANGNPRQETNRYAPVSQEQREERKAEEKKKDTDSLAKKQNTTVKAMVNEMAVIDPRTAKTNLFNPSKQVYLTPFCWYVWDTTVCKETKEQGNLRFEAFKKANLTRYNALVIEGKKEKAKQECAIRAKALAEERRDIYMSADNPDFFDEDYADELYKEAKQKREAKAAKEIADREAKRIKDELKEGKFAQRVKMQQEESRAKREEELRLANDALDKEEIEEEPLPWVI